MKVATWNVNSLKVRLEHVLAWMESERPDVLALQETKTRDDNFPVDAFRERGYSAVYSGQAGYNGVALISRLPAEDVAHGIGGGYVDDAKRVLGATFGSVRVLSLYVPNGQRVDSDKYVYTLGWLTALRGLLAAEIERHPQLLVVGDFNIAPDDRDVYDPVAWAGQVLCTPAERAALEAFIDFRGRPPDLDPLLRQSGIAQPTPPQ